MTVTTETLRSPQELATHHPQTARTESPSEQSAQARQNRESTIYRCVAGALMVTLIGFGILQLMEVIRV